MKDHALIEAKRLWDLGFAIHWLRPKSKVPLEAGWTTGPRKDWRALEKIYQKGLNVGVRLGEASAFKDTYLAVIDVDVKSKDHRHRGEALSAARRLFSECKIRPPCVKSGRGNGSRHYYCRTSSPIKTYDPATSSETVTVYQPSKKASRKELEQLGVDAVNQGMRLSAAWQVSVYSHGRQVVLPPSIHPDTGKKYRWSKPFLKVSQAPLLLLGAPSTALEGERATPDSKKSFRVKPVDVDWLPISEKTRSLITDSTDGDRSAALLGVVKSLAAVGLDEDEILSVLTDKKNKLSEVAYEHAKTTDRARAAQWLYKYTTKKAVSEVTDVSAFDIETPQPTKLSAEEREKASKEIEDESDSAAETRGFYSTDDRGKNTPEYVALMTHFERQHPFRSVADMKTIYVFSGTHYKDWTPIEVKAFAEEKFRPHPTNRVRVEFFDKVLVNHVVRRDFFFQTTEGKVNFKNGVLDLNGSMEVLSPHSEKFGFRGVLPYEYDPKAECPLFRKWLKGVMKGDEDLIASVQEFMGYIVRGGEYRYHKALWLEGSGRNGKSTFIDVLKALIGSGNYSTISIKSLVGDKFAGADLDGKIANFSEETSPQELADSGPFKNLTGDGDIFAQKKYGDPYSFRNRAKLVMSYNQIPDLKDLSSGMLSRPLIIPFRKEISEDEQDHDIKDKLCKELPGIFNFALEGWRRLERQNRFTLGSLSKEALVKIKTESCNALQWVENYITFTDVVEDETKWKTALEMYESYKMKERYPFTFMKFCKRISEHPEMKKRKGKDREKHYYWGV